MSGVAKYHEAVKVERTPDELIEPVGHLDDGTPPAPGDLELVRAFLSLHDHASETEESVSPLNATITAWLRSAGLLDDALVPEDDVRWAAAVHEALRIRVLENMGAGHDSAADRVLDDAVARTGLTPRFGDAVAPLVPRGTGIQRAVGRILAVAFLADLDGTWNRFRECSDPSCHAVFWDRSKNRSGRWCSMASCGNRAKVRAYRERHATR